MSSEFLLWFGFGAFVILMLVLGVWGKSRKALLVGVLAGVAVSTLEMAILYHPYTDPSRVYYGTDTRAAALLLGSALAFVWAPWRLIGRTDLKLFDLNASPPPLLRMGDHLRFVPTESRR